MLDDKSEIPADWDRSGLPGWAYFSNELFALERDMLFRTHWQLVCHISEVADAGQYVTLDIADERGLVIRGHDNEVRAFHNLCRHRGSRVVGDDRGTCNKALICPYHGWAYNLDGTLRGIASKDTFPPLDPDKWGLKPLEMEIWMGFVFVRFQPGPQPSVATVMGRFDDEIRPYRTEDMICREPTNIFEAADVNWKSVRDVDNEGYHVRQAHPGLHDLYGEDYFDEPYINGTSRSFGPFKEGPSKSWSVRNYRKILPKVDGLPDSHQNAWVYFGMFPNTVIGLYPDGVFFYQEIPVSPTQTKQRGGIVGHADESREMKAARYLSGRIDNDTVKEDQMLTIWACEATKSSAFDGIMLSDLEYGLKTYHDHLRTIMPILSQTTEPTEGTLAQQNTALLKERR
ncbi:MAG: aromatic ring-hydroxylating dioxygenase subunit alpha [Amylibacter sp.]|jgi:phenylpropionate dioxygenase-like ring-hydroxylating dioxygenase large terminal subunit|nr:aromatic ring-hydroxylating dioxygenase subunit alpha [Amylibacter sp.]